MPLLNITFAVICWISSFLIGGLIGGVAFWAYKRKKPMPFWSGSIIEPEEITDIPAYNRANGLMWAIYASSMALAGVFSLFNIIIGAVMFGVIIILGTVVLIKVHKKIYNRYKSALGRYRIEI